MLAKQQPKTFFREASNGLLFQWDKSDLWDSRHGEVHGGEGASAVVLYAQTYCYLRLDKDDRAALADFVRLGGLLINIGKTGFVVRVVQLRQALLGGGHVSCFRSFVLVFKARYIAPLIDDVRMPCEQERRAKEDRLISRRENDQKIQERFL